MIIIFCKDIKVPVDGNRFFGKHIAVVGSTGSGKSHTVAKILQTAVMSKTGQYEGLNNSHIVIFDIHSEYKAAFPDAHVLDISNLVLPYWMMNSDELQELFLDTEANDHNQRNVFKEAVVNSRKKYFTGDAEKKEKIHFDSPLFFDANEVLQVVKDKNNEMVPGKTGEKAGPLNGKLSNFVSRLENKINDSRLDFLLGEKSKTISFSDTLKQLIAYGENKSNITILDLSGVPFDVLSITVSLISRILFEYGYYYKRLRCDRNPTESVNNDIPLLLVYEEAHKYDKIKERWEKLKILAEDMEKIEKRRSTENVWGKRLKYLSVQLIINCVFAILVFGVIEFVASIDYINILHNFRFYLKEFLVICRIDEWIVRIMEYVHSNFDAEMLVENLFNIFVIGTLFTLLSNWLKVQDFLDSLKKLRRGIEYGCLAYKVSKKSVKKGRRK